MDIFTRRFRTRLLPLTALLGVLMSGVTLQATDTDGDGVLNGIDLDDDNDGILNGVEIQGAGNCPYGFFHMIDGQLNVFDEQNDVYTPIGARHVNINAMGFDDQSGKLYAAVRQATTDDYGTPLAQYDIIEIDRYTGKIKKASAHNHKIGSFTADFYDGKLYARTGNKEFTIWDKAADSTTTLTLDTAIYTADVALSAASGTLTAYGVGTTNTASGATDNTRLYRINMSDGSVVRKTFTVTTPDDLNLSVSWGATFFANDNTGSRKLYAANNNGYIYEITGIDTNTPGATYRYRSVATNQNDGASCKDANQYAVDSDSDGIPDYLDLDSDNDGIPDNVEAQPTSGYVAPLGTDSDHDGLADQYDDNTSGALNSNGLIPVDTKGDNRADFLDTDSDNDGYTDCEEGLPDTTSGKSCPITSVQGNGMVSWANTAADYSDPNGKVNDPSSDLFNETGDTSEVGYREFLCGKTEYQLTSMQWRLISMPCNTGSATVDTLFSSLGTYGTNYVLYKQTGDDNYEVNATHTNTNKTQLVASDTLTQGVSYWIIADSDHTVTIDKTISGLAPTAQQDTAALSITDPDFKTAHSHALPANAADYVKKYMAGNPYPYGFDLSNLYFSHTAATSGYHPMGDSANNAYINATVYKHDSSETGPVTGYEAVTPSTPGFNAPIVPMEGFFIKLETNSDAGSNYFAYPQTYGNDK